MTACDRSNRPKDDRDRCWLRAGHGEAWPIRDAAADPPIRNPVDSSASAGNPAAKKREVDLDRPDQAITLPLRPRRSSCADHKSP